MSDNKRIAKNTAFLYLRQLIIMVVSIYTSRVILDVLGASDYGIYNVVGGIVTMMSFSMVHWVHHRADSLLMSWGVVTRINSIVPFQLRSIFIFV